VQINAGTKLIALIGNPLKQTLSPLVHNATFTKQGINCLYIPYEITEEKLEQGLLALKNLGYLGLNVTIPYKQKVIKYLDEISKEAYACQAVNVIKIEDGKLIGHNTDGKGFLISLQEEGVNLIGGQAVIIGAGGAARPIAYELAHAGMKKIDLLDIDYVKAEEVAQMVGEKSDCRAEAWEMSQELFNHLSRNATILVNCSPLGMAPYPDNAPVSDMHEAASSAVVCDIIYNPIKTRFLEMAENRGLKTISGLSMFIHQAALTLEIILNITPPVGFMKEVVQNKT